MTVEDALESLIEHWDDVSSRLGAARAQELRDLIAQVGGAEHTATVTRITQLLVVELPPEHPVRRALAKGYMFTRAPADWLALREELLESAGVAGAWTAAPMPDAGQHDAAASRAAATGDDDETPGDILAAVTDRLLRAPALTEDEVRRRGADPSDPGLIRLQRPDGGRQWPSFQFASEGAALGIVRSVNLMLGAEYDPLGVADWWLGANAGLDGRPSDLIGEVPDELLLRAARAVTEEV